MIWGRHSLGKEENLREEFGLWCLDTVNWRLMTSTALQVMELEYLLMHLR